MDRQSRNPGSAGFHPTTWVIGAVLVSLTIGTVTGLRLGAAAQLEHRTASSLRPMTTRERAFPEGHAASPRITERFDNPVVGTTGASKPEQPGASLAEYGP